MYTSRVYLFLITLCLAFSGCLDAKLSISPSTTAASSSSSGALGSSSASAAPDVQPWCTNGTVNTSLRQGNTLYVGGSFTQVGKCSGNGLPIDLTTGLLANGITVPTLAKPNNNVNAVTDDGAGGWFVGGTFTQIGMYVYPYLAHVKFDGTIDGAFSPAPNAAVTALARTGTKLYVTGNFTNIGGQARNYMAELNTTTGAANAFNPSPNAPPSALALDSSGTYLYVGGGSVTTISALSRNKLAKYNTTTDTIDASFVPGTFTGSQVYALAVDSGNSNLYVGGTFSTLSSMARNNIGAVDTIAGAAVSAFNPNANAMVHELAVSGASVYAVGSFSTIGGQTRNAVAELSQSTGSATTWNPSLSAAASLTSIVISGSTAYVGGNQTTANAVSHQGVAAIDLTTGNASAWDPALLGFGSYVTSLAISGGAIYVGATLSVVGSSAIQRNALAAIDAKSGVGISSWDAGISTPGAIVSSMTTLGSQLYFGGSIFTTVQAQVRNYLASVSLATGAIDLNWDPSPNGNVNAVTTDGTNIIFGGNFTTVNYGGLARISLAAANTLGAIQAIPNITISPGMVNALAYDCGANTLYVGGTFTGATCFGGTSKAYGGAINMNTGAVISAWNASGISGTGINTMLLANGTLYVGGNFMNMGGQSRQNAAQLDLSTGAATAWNPGPNAVVNALTADPSRNQIILGGNFTLISATTRGRIAAVDASSGALGLFDVPGTSAQIFTLSTSGNTVYLGGQFMRLQQSDSQFGIGAADLSTYNLLAR